MPHLTRRDRSPTTLEELLTLHDAPFVRAAYLLLLGREADPVGLDGYTRLLRDGAPRARVLRALSSCEEAHHFGSALIGLDAYLAREDVPEAGRLKRALARLGQLLNRHQQPALRALENNLASVAYAVDEMRQLVCDGSRVRADEPRAQPGAQGGAELHAIATRGSLSPETSAAALRIATSLSRSA